MSYEQGMEDREYIVKTWGMEEILTNNEHYCGKLLWITPGFECSLHFHSIKHETFVALDGMTYVEYYVDGKKLETVLVGWRRDLLTLPPRTPHRFRSLGGEGSLLLEISTPHSDMDVTRLAPSRELPPDDGLDEDEVEADDPRRFDGN